VQSTEICRNEPEKCWRPIKLQTRTFFNPEIFNPQISPHKIYKSKVFKQKHLLCYTLNCLKNFTTLFGNGKSSLYDKVLKMMFTKWNNWRLWFNNQVSRLTSILSQLAQNVRDTEALLCCEFQIGICKIGGVIGENVHTCFEYYSTHVP